MRYLGGKSKIAKWITAAIRPHMRGRPFWDAFCGGLSMSLELSAAAGAGLVTDANPALIALYRAVAAGWDPPELVSIEMYEAAKTLPDSDPLKAFIGFGCSFGGKWFGGYARSRPTANGTALRNDAAETRRTLTTEIPELVDRKCEIACVDFLAVEPKPTGLVLYLDPPYQGTTVYGALSAFNYPKFYQRAIAWSRHTDVFISEYACPVGRCVLEFGHTLSVSGGAESNARTERLYHLAPGDR